MKLTVVKFSTNDFEFIKFLNIFLCNRIFNIYIHSIGIQKERTKWEKKEQKGERERKKIVIVVGGVSSLAPPIGGTSSSRLNGLEPAGPNGSVRSESFPGCGSSRLIETHQQESRCGDAASLDSATDSDLESESVGCLRPPGVPLPTSWFVDQCFDTWTVQ